jgi:pimeloyl-ACP methyl ester carboxylesterase
MPVDTVKLSRFLVNALAATLALGLPAQTFAASPPASGLCPVGVDAPTRIPLARLRALYGAKGDRYVTIDGVELRYRDEGTGPVLLLLHGSRSTLNQWDGLTARLKNRYRIVRFDQPPAGLSGHLTTEAMARVGSPEALVAKFLDALKIGKVIPVGVSSGGTMAYYFAATYPDRVDGVVLTNTPADSAAELQFTVTPALDAATKRSHELGVEGRAFWANYLGFLYGDGARMEPGLIDRYCTLNLREKEANPFGLHALTANKDVTSARLAAMRAPVLVAWGMRDKVLPPATADRLLARLPAAQSRSFVALDTVGHYPPMESPDAVADLIDSWIRRNR